MKNKLCCIFTTAPHYRKAIYELIDRTYDCIWFFNDEVNDIKRIDYNDLAGRVYIKKLHKLPLGFTYQSGMVAQLFKPYKKYFVFLYSNSLSTYLFLFLSKLFPGKKVIGWTHGWYGKETKMEALIKKIVFKQADEILTYGNYARELMIKEGFKADHIHTIHNSLNYEEQIKLRNSNLDSNIYKEHFGNNLPVLIFIGRLTAVKKLDMLIHALACLKEKGKFFNLILVGDGVEKYRLEELTQKLQLSKNVWYYGACYDERMNAELIFNADLCVAPGNVGLTAMHTMVFGTPVLSHDNFSFQMPEFEAIVPGKTGDFFTYNDLNSLANKISEWFATNGNIRDEIRANCYKEIDSQWNPQFQINVIKSVI